MRLIYKIDLLCIIIIVVTHIKDFAVENHSQTKKTLFTNIVQSIFLLMSN